MDNKTDNLFSEFPPVSIEEWEEAIKKDLRGADYKKKLRWHTGEGIDALPFYRRESMQQERGAPIQKLSTDEKANSWEIRELIFESGVEEANNAALAALNRGADALQIAFEVRRTEGMLGGDLRGVSLQNQEDFSRFLEGIPIEETGLHFDSGIASPALLGMLWNKVQEQDLNQQKIRASFSYDPFVFLLDKGHYPKPKEELKQDIAKLARFCSEELPGVRPLCIDARLYHNSGATIVQELGYALAAASEYLSLLTEAGIETDQATTCLHLSFSIGSSYFLEMAKFRAARVLWNNLVEAYKGDPKKATPYLHGETSRWNKTLYDPYSNMLRSSTEAMSAAIGSCDSVTVLPFDFHFRNPDSFSKRIARNQQVILSEEAYLHKVSDPSAGSYYIEKLTDALGSKAWNLFKEIEAEGGLFKAIEHGTIQSAIQESQEQRDREIATRKRIFIGTNQYSDPDETAGEKQTSSEPTVSLDTSDETFRRRDSEDEPLVSFLARSFTEGAKLGDLVDHLFNYQKQEYRTVHPYRGSLPFEELRQATEQNDSTPLVLMLPLGNRKMRKARAAFASNFFGCAGYTIEEPVGFESMEEATTAIEEKNPDIIVVCSSDEEYEELVPKLGKQLEQFNHKPVTVLAGNPKERSKTYREAGIDTFIHADSNVLKTLTDFQRKLGIIDNET